MCLHFESSEEIQNTKSLRERDMHLSGKWVGDARAERAWRDLDMVKYWHCKPPD